MDATGDVGRHASIAIGFEGNPIVAYYDVTNGALKLARCNDLACAGSNETLTTLDPSGGTFTSIALGIDERPVISYLGAGIEVARPAISN